MLLKKGNSGKDVQTLQRALHLLDDGIFGQLTEDAVKEFQKLHGLKVDGIVGDKTWAAICGSSLIKSKRIINEIIVHCSATREGFDYTISDITNWHKKRGFTTIGYHYVIYRDGSIHTGRNINVSGAHCEGHNSHSVGVCYIGGLENRLNPKNWKYDIPKDTRTAAQKASLLKLLKELKRLYPTAKIIGHRDTSPDKNGDGLIEPSEWIKACPSFDAKEEYKCL